MPASYVPLAQWCVGVTIGVSEGGMFSRGAESPILGSNPLPRHSHAPTP